MFVKKAFYILLPVFLLVAAQSNAQVITTKKEAEKKGVYKKPTTSETVSPDVKSTIGALTSNTSDKSTTKPVAQTNTKTPVTAAKPASSKPVAQKAKSKKALLNDKEDPDLVPSPEENYVAVQMINNAMTFIGTRYLGGGTTTSGMDCSGMVTAVYKLFDMKLPRSSNAMAQVGQKVDNKEIKKGDLVFFHTNGKRVINHVGMVVEVLEDEIKFVHSSTQKGVIISSTKEPYYKKNFVQANRML
ncbi:MAG: peptidoglycan endopeptidase [Flavobacterium sp.]|uniref:C40 family peptidase n=1 Tax=Flavobacterium sp. TaxID=239 RepID=UPI001209DECB|nr:C40 family peptidase [Flavobacterium sp.]RZJ66708.1 MAG: peptidoglycan endopeptidase [Flavobacterium sp.]